VTKGSVAIRRRELSVAFSTIFYEIASLRSQ